METVQESYVCPISFYFSYRLSFTYLFLIFFLAIPLHSLSSFISNTSRHSFSFFTLCTPYHPFLSLTLSLYFSYNLVSPLFLSLPFLPYRIRSLPPSSPIPPCVSPVPPPSSLPQASLPVNDMCNAACVHTNGALPSLSGCLHAVIALRIPPSSPLSLPPALLLLSPSIPLFLPPFLLRSVFFSLIPLLFPPLYLNLSILFRFCPFLHLSPVLPSFLYP